MKILLLKNEGIWVAQMLEYDLAAQGPTQQAALEALKETLDAAVAISKHYEEAPLVNFRPAPKRYWRQFEEARGERRRAAAMARERSQPVVPLMFSEVLNQPIVAIA